ncbi:hypothetical protein ACVW17_005224 [Bradyrhizobium sp. USDA 4473]
MPCVSSQRGDSGSERRRNQTDHRADAAQREHPAPAEMRNDDPADQRRDEQRAVGAGRERRAPAPALLRRDEFAEHDIADDDLGAEPETHHEARRDQPVHRRRQRRRQRADAEDQEVGLIGELPSEAVAGNACQPGADQHPDKRRRDEARILGEVRISGLDQRAQDAAGEENLEAIDEQSGSDQCEDPVVKSRDRQPVEPPARVDACRGQFCLPDFVF